MNNFVSSGMTVYWDATTAEHEAKLDELRNQGHRILSLSVYGAPLNARYAAVWFRQPGPDWRECHDKNVTEYKLIRDQWATKGFRPTIITATGPDASARFAGVFEKSPSSKSFAEPRLTS